MFSLERAKNIPNSPAPFTGNVGAIESMKAVDPLTIEFKTKGPTPEFIEPVQTIPAGWLYVMEGEAPTNTFSGNVGPGYPGGVSRTPVREALLERQRRFAAQPGGAVLDGRDIGTVIAPEADAKLFVTASPEVRAQRRYAELKRIGLDIHLPDVLADIRARDERDRGRAEAPLRPAEDAVILDTSEMAIQAAIEAAVAAVEARRR